MDENNKTDLEVLTSILAALKTLDSDAQKRTLQAVASFLGIDAIRENRHNAETKHSHGSVPFSENRDITPKDFLRDKLPQTDVDRIACLAYYLTHYKNMPHFKTLDLSALNTEAAQPKFSNAAVAVSNASRAGFLVQASKGNNQISSAGELYVQALPDYDAARARIASMRIKKRTKKSTPQNQQKN
jgi:hypothetical protein